MKKIKNNRLLGNKLFDFLENNEDTNNDVTKSRVADNTIKVNESDIKNIFQEFITLSSESLTMQFDKNNISNLDSVANTIFGLANDLKNKVEKIKSAS